MGRWIVAALAILAGCSSATKTPVGPVAVVGSVDLEKPRAGAPDGGTSAGHGNEVAVATTSSDVFSFTGRVDPPDSVVEVSDGVVRVEASGRFTVGVASPASGTKALTLRATHPARRPWSLWP